MTSDRPRLGLETFQHLLMMYMTDLIFSKFKHPMHWNGFKKQYCQNSIIHYWYLDLKMNWLAYSWARCLRIRSSSCSRFSVANQNRTHLNNSMFHEIIKDWDQYASNHSYHQTNTWNVKEKQPTVMLPQVIKHAWLCDWTRKNRIQQKLRASLCNLYKPYR